jgi:hypothetical protein
MELQRITEKQQKKLFELGCEMAENELIYTNLALKWFRDVKMIKNAVCFLFYNTQIEMWYGDFKRKVHYSATCMCSTYEKAESELLEELLKLEL